MCDGMKDGLRFFRPFFSGLFTDQLQLRFLSVLKFSAQQFCPHSSFLFILIIKATSIVNSKVWRGWNGDDNDNLLDWHAFSISPTIFFLTLRLLIIVIPTTRSHQISVDWLILKLSDQNLILLRTYIRTKVHREHKKTGPWF